MKNCYEEYSSGRISKTTGFILAKLSLAYRQACYEMLWRIRSDREWEFLNHPESILFRPHKIPSENMWLWAKSPRMVPQNHWFMDVYFPSHIFIGNLTHPECTAELEHHRQPKAIAPFSHQTSPNPHFKLPWTAYLCGEIHGLGRCSSSLWVCVRNLWIKECCGVHRNTG